MKIDGQKIEMFAWIGMDEHGSGRIGLKQGRTVAGFIPLATMDFDQNKLKKLKPGLEVLSKTFGKKIYLVRLEMVEIVDQTEAGE